MNNDTYSKVVFEFLMLSIAPTIIMGFLNISTYTNQIVWIWDVLMIIILAVYCMLKKFKIFKNTFIPILLFFIVIIFQILDYSSAISNGTINRLYTILPLVYFVHFFCSFVLVGGQRKELNWERFFELFILFVVFCCCYNLIINYNNFSRIFAFNNKYLGFSSFFNHRNGFGQLLFLGIVSNVYILSYKKNKFYYITAFLIILNLTLTFSRTSILSTIVFFIVYFLQCMFSKKEKKSTLIGMLLILVIISVIIVGINNEKIINFVNYYIFRSEDGLSGRDTIWKIALSNIKGFRILTGYGIGTTSKLLENYGLTNSHNAIIEIILTGGLQLLLFYFIIFINIIKNIMKFDNAEYKKIYISFLIAFFVYIIFEKILLFSTGYAPIMFTIFLVVIPKLSKKREENNEKRIN